MSRLGVQGRPLGGGSSAYKEVRSQPGVLGGGVVMGEEAGQGPVVDKGLLYWYNKKSMAFEE